MSYAMVGAVDPRRSGPEQENVTGRQVGILGFGPSEQEKTLAKRVLSGFLTNYANALIRVQYANKAMRDWSKFATDSRKKLTDPDVRIVINGFKSIATEGIAQMKRIKPHLDEYAKFDKGLWDKLTALEQAYSKQMSEKGKIIPANTSVKTDGGTEFNITASQGTVSDQVGVEPVTIAILVIVTITVLAISAAAVGYMIKQTAQLSAENRATNASKRTFDELSKSQMVIQKAQADKAAGKITAADADKIIENEKQFQTNVLKTQAEATKPVGAGKSLPWVPIGIGVGLIALGWFAWKQGWIQKSLGALQGSGMMQKLQKQVT